MDTEGIWNEYRQEMVAYIRKRVNNEFDAEDILQEVFEKFTRLSTN